MEYRFPREINRPYMILHFEGDEFAMGFLVFFAAIICALLVDSTLVGFLLAGLGFTGIWYYRRQKKHYPKAFFKHLLWMVGFIKLDGYPDYFQRTFEE